MVRLNKTHLQQKQINQLFQQLAKVIAPKHADHAANTLSELLGQEERIMLAKRLAVIVLLSEGFSAYRIADELKLSQSTIAATAEKLNSGAYRTIEQNLRKDTKNYFAILEVIDSVLHLGGILPHYNGMDRYRGL